MACGFGLLAFRLIFHRRAHTGLMSPLALRLWGSFFALGAVVVLIHAIFTGQWPAIAHFWTLTTGACSMAVAAFVLARNRQRSKVTSHQVTTFNSRPPSPVHTSPGVQTSESRTTPFSGGCG
jgi:hypothetical protein